LTAQRGVVAAAGQLGSIQLQAGDLLAALSSFSRVLQAAEQALTIEGAQASVATRQAVADANRRVGEVLIRNGAGTEGGAKLRKALEIYQQLSTVEKDSPSIAASVLELENELGAESAR
jgi:hypothetical protein